MSTTINFPNLRITITESEHEAHYSFHGHVDESFRQEEVPRVQKPTIVFTLAEITNFNSCGIREWIYLVRDVCHLGHLIFRECSVSMIDQINMVPDSLGSGRIESFYAPYFCDCGGEVSRLVVVNDWMAFLKSKAAPEFSCEQCGKPLEFDALEESYFLFTENFLPRAG